MEDFIPYELEVKLKEKGFKVQGGFQYLYYNEELVKVYDYCNISPYKYAPTISQVLKWLREEKNIDIEIHADVGMLGIKVYSPYISTYTKFTLETFPDNVRYRQKKFNPTTRLPHEIIPAHVHFKEWEQAALAGIKYVIDNLI